MKKRCEARGGWDGRAWGERLELLQPGVRRGGDLGSTVDKSRQAVVEAQPLRVGEKSDQVVEKLKVGASSDLQCDIFNIIYVSMFIDLASTWVSATNCRSTRSFASWTPVSSKSRLLFKNLRTGLSRLLKCDPLSKLELDTRWTSWEVIDILRSGSSNPQE